MSSAITTTLHHLLMEEDHVTLPGIGTIRLVPQAALISPHERKAAPPSEQVTFNSNLVLDDGRLLRALKESGALDTATASYQLKQFLSNARENLDAGRAVTLEGIGRLNKHFDGQIKFTAARGANFSKESFGLPVVDLQPIQRTEKQRRAAITADPMAAASPPLTTATTTSGKSTASLGSLQEILHHPDLRRILWYVAGVLAAILVVCLLYLLGQTIGAALADDPTEPVARVRTEPVPADEPPRLRPAPNPVPARTVAPDDPPRLNDGETSGNTTPSREPVTSVTPPPATAPSGSVTEPVSGSPPTVGGDNVSLIATGLYGSQRNVTKNLRRIEEAGYESFSRPEGRYTRVGVRLSYRTEEEKLAALAAIRRRFSEDSFEMERNGVVVPLQ